MSDTKLIVTKDKLDKLATSISTKSGVATPMTIAQMKAAVDGIAGGTITQDEDGYIVLEQNGGGSLLYEEITVETDGEVTQTLEANKIYHFTSNALTSLTITLAETSDIAQYHFDFISPSTPVTLTLPSTVVMPASFSLNANTRYEIDILNGYGVAQRWAVSVNA